MAENKREKIDFEAKMFEAGYYNDCIFIVGTLLSTCLAIESGMRRALLSRIRGKRK